MNIAHITPIANRDVMSSHNHYIMGLSHLCNIPEYSSWLLKASNSLGKYVILDNSLIELGAAVDIKKLMTDAYVVKAQEVILPDVFQNGSETIRAVEDSLEQIYKLGFDSAYTGQFMAVCQGATIDDFHRCYERLLKIKEVEAIGIPKVCAKMHPAGRPYFEQLWYNDTIEIHLLGLWYGWEELRRYRSPARIRSMDSCLASFQVRYNLEVGAIRPDGFTLDLQDESLVSRKIIRQIEQVRTIYE